LNSHAADNVVSSSINDTPHLLSLPTVKSRPSSSAPKFQMSSSLMARNESWSSFSSLHSLPETFFALSRGGPINGSRHLFADSRDSVAADDGRRAFNKEANDCAGTKGTEGLANNKLLFNKQMSYPGVVAESLEVDPTHNGYSTAVELTNVQFSVCGPEDEALGANDDRTLKSSERAKKEFKMFEEKSLSKSIAHSTNVVFHNLMRAKSFTSKTLRRLNPKLALGGKISENPSEGKAVQSQPVRTDLAPSGVFRTLRHKSLEPRLSIGSTNSLCFTAYRERSPLAAVDSSVEEGAGDRVRGHDRDPPFIFGANEDCFSQDGERERLGVSVTQRLSAQSIAARGRAASCIEHEDADNSLSLVAAAGNRLPVSMDYLLPVSEPDILRTQPDFKPVAHSAPKWCRCCCCCWWVRFESQRFSDEASSCDRGTVSSCSACLAGIVVNVVR
jgi:hypothetical protein